MPAAEDENVAELSGEETRCFLGLKAYYVKIEERNEEDAAARAWADLKREHKRLEPFNWFK